MSAQLLLKSLYKGAAIQSDLEIVGIKAFCMGPRDCLDCKDDCACTFN